VWGADHETAASIGRRIRTGTMNINTFMMDMCSPFGGFKASGLGRELGPEGLEAFLQTQTVAHAAQG
jgi:aldehyde dehydrogenase (NAD+)